MRTPIVSEEDADALRWADVEERGGVPYIKFAAWSRWKRLDKHLTGTLCFNRNGDPWDLRRENLIPALQPWKKVDNSTRTVF